MLHFDLTTQGYTIAPFEMELLPVMSGFEKFRQSLSESIFLAHTDHDLLEWLYQTIELYFNNAFKQMKLCSFHSLRVDFGLF
jgi:RNase H-like domain found in reverse transcriptase